MMRKIKRYIRIHKIIIRLLDWDVDLLEKGTYIVEAYGKGELIFKSQQKTICKGCTKYTSTN